MERAGGIEPPTFSLGSRPELKVWPGAGGGNRTRTKSLGSFQATTTSRPQSLSITS